MVDSITLIKCKLNDMMEWEETGIQENFKIIKKLGEGYNCDTYKAVSADIFQNLVIVAISFLFKPPISRKYAPPFLGSQVVIYSLYILSPLTLFFIYVIPHQSFKRFHYFFFQRYICHSRIYSFFV